MNKKKFTPGLKVRNYNCVGGVDLEKKVAVTIYLEYGAITGSESTLATDKEKTAELSNLIAAAPDMLAELEKICAGCSRLCSREPEECEKCTTNSAIKKAYGETP